MTGPGPDSGEHLPGKNIRIYNPPPAAPAVPPVVVARSAGVAVAASFFVPGLGSMISGRAGKGVAILAAYVVAIALCFAVIGFVLAPACWIYGMVTAATDARQWNAGHGITS